MTGLWFDGVPISLKDESGIQLGIDLLRRRYAIETIRYIDLGVDFMYCAQGTVKECLRMARVFLLYLLGADLFANGGQTVSLRWLAIF